jgi:hypothetical protein
MKKSLPALFLAVAGVVLLSAVFVVQAQDATGTANGNTNDNTNLNVPPPPLPPVNANTGNLNPPPPPVNDNTNLNVPPPPLPPVNDNTNLNVPPPPLPPANANTNTSTPPLPPPNVHPATNVAPNSGTAASTSGQLVKIPNPDYIKYFREIRQIGASLYGILINSANGLMGNIQPTSGTTPTAQNSSTAPTATATGGTIGGVGQTTQQLEKILSPDMIKFYTAIKKIGSSLFGVRLGGSVPGNVTPKPYRVVTAEESACVISAIKAKDQAITDGKTAEATAFNAAVAARTACQTTALGGIDGQLAALQTCAKSFVTAAKQSQATFAKAQKDAWTTYTAALKVCGPAPSTTAGGIAPGTATGGTTPSGDIMVEDGSNLVQPQASGM